MKSGSNVSQRVAEINAIDEARKKRILDAQARLKPLQGQQKQYTKKIKDLQTIQKTIRTDIAAKQLRYEEALDTQTQSMARLTSERKQRILLQAKRDNVIALQAKYVDTETESQQSSMAPSIDWKNSLHGSMDRNNNELKQIDQELASIALSEQENKTLQMVTESLKNDLDKLKIALDIQEREIDAIKVEQSSTQKLIDIAENTISTNTKSIEDSVLFSLNGGKMSGTELDEIVERNISQHTDPDFKPYLELLMQSTTFQNEAGKIDKLYELYKRNKDQEAQISALNLEKNSAIEALGELQNKYNNVEQERELRDQNLTRLITEVDQVFDDKIQQYQDRISGLTSDLGTNKQNVVELQTQLANMTEVRSNLEKELEVSKQEIEKQQQRHRQELIAKVQELETNQKAFSQFKEEAIELSNELKQNKDEIQNLQQELLAIEQLASLSKSKLAEIDKTYERYVKEVASAKASIQEPQDSAKIVAEGGVTSKQEEKQQQSTQETIEINMADEQDSNIAQNQKAKTNKLEKGLPLPTIDEQPEFALEQQTKKVTFETSETEPTILEAAPITLTEEKKVNNKALNDPMLQAQVLGRADDSEKRMAPQKQTENKISTREKVGQPTIPPQISTKTQIRIAQDSISFDPPSAASSLSLAQSSLELNESQVAKQQIASIEDIDPITKAMREQIIAKQMALLKAALNMPEIAAQNPEQFKEFVKDPKNSALLKETFQAHSAAFNDIEVNGYKEVHKQFSDKFKNLEWEQNGAPELRTKEIKNDKGEKLCALTEKNVQQAVSVVMEDGSSKTIASYRSVDYPKTLDNGKGPMHLSMVAKDENGNNMPEDSAVYFSAHYNKDGKLEEVTSPIPLKFIGKGDDAIGYIEREGKIYTLPVTQGKYKEMMKEVEQNKGTNVDISKSIEDKKEVAKDLVGVAATDSKIDINKQEKPMTQSATVQNKEQINETVRNMRRKLANTSEHIRHNTLVTNPKMKDINKDTGHWAR